MRDVRFLAILPYLNMMVHFGSQDGQTNYKMRMPVRPVNVIHLLVPRVFFV